MHKPLGSRHALSQLEWQYPHVLARRQPKTGAVQLETAMIPLRLNPHVRAYVPILGERCFTPLQLDLSPYSGPAGRFDIRLGAFSASARRRC